MKFFSATVHFYNIEQKLVSKLLLLIAYRKKINIMNVLGIVEEDYCFSVNK